MNLFLFILLLRINKIYCSILVGTLDGYIHSLNEENGNEEWNFDSGGPLATYSGDNGVFVLPSGEFLYLNPHGVAKVCI